MMSSIVALPWRYIALAGVLGATHMYAYVQGSNSVEKEYEAYKTQVARAASLAEAENARKLSAVATAAQRASDGWAAARAALDRSKHVVRVRAGSCAGGVPSVPTDAGGLDAVRVEEPVVGTEVSVAECETRLGYAVDDAAYIEWVKQWVREVHDGSSRH